MLSVFCAPHRYFQGKGAILSLGEELAYLGCKDPVLIIVSKSADKLLKDNWKKTFYKVSMKYLIHYFNGECSEEEIELIKSLVKKNEVKTVIVAGGGKVIDTARAVARGLDLPIISCPTISSSDSPCSALSVIYKKNGDFDHYSIHNKNPDLVLVDTEIIAKSPLRFLVAGMGDALATFFEAATCVEGNKKNMRGGLPTQASLALAKLYAMRLFSNLVLKPVRI